MLLRLRGVRGTLALDAALGASRQRRSGLSALARGATGCPLHHCSSPGIASDKASLSHISRFQGTGRLLRHPVGINRAWTRSLSYPTKLEDGKVDNRKTKPPSKHVAINLEIVACESKGDAEGLLALVRRETRTIRGIKFVLLSHANIATWLNRWSKMEESLLRGPAPPEVLLVLARTLYLLDTKPDAFQPRHISNVANAVCKFSYEWRGDRPEPEVVLDKVAQWCLARAFRDFDPQVITNVVNAFARSNYQPPVALLEMICKACKGTGLQAFTPQGISNLVNGLAKLNHDPGKALLGLICAKCAESGLEGFKPQELSNLVNGLAKLNHDPGKVLLGLLCGRCEDVELRGFKPQELSNLVNGLAKLNHDPGKALLGLLCRRCEEVELRGFNPQELSAMLNGLAKLEHDPGPIFMESLASRCQGIGLERFTPRDVSTIFNGFANFGYHPGDALLSGVVRMCIARRLEGFEAVVMSVLLHALSIFLVPVDEGFTRVFYTRASEVGWDSFDLQGLGLTLWGMVVLERRVDKALLREVIARMRAIRASIAQGEKGLDTLGCRTICSAAMQYLLLRDRSTWDVEDEELSREAGALWPDVEGYRDTPSPSMLQTGVCRALRSRQYVVKEEVWLAGGVLSVDAVVELPCGARVAVEVDGPLHFFSNRPHEPTGRTVLKRRLLDRAQARGEVQAWAWVRDGSREELDKVEQAVARAHRQGRGGA